MQIPQYSRFTAGTCAYYCWLRQHTRNRCGGGICFDPRAQRRVEMRQDGGGGKEFDQLAKHFFLIFAALE